MAIIDIKLKSYDELTFEITKLNTDIYLKNKEIYLKNKEIQRLNKLRNEIADEILKELKENRHLSYGVALTIRQKLIDYKEIQGSDKDE